LTTQAFNGSDSRQILQDLVHYRTYAGTQFDGRKENRTQVIDRVKQMHQTRFPWYTQEVEEAFTEVYRGRTVPSMRTMQFGGSPIFRSNARAYNCAFTALTSWKDFADMFWLLMNGVGTGYSVQTHHVEQLGAVEGQHGEIFIVPDSKEGWADGILALLSNPYVEIQTHLIRPKGAPISSGGTASGPESLTEMYEKVRTILISAVGRNLTPLECFDIMSHIADVVVVGGVRRAATIALFDADDEEMLTAKHGEWYLDNPQRARANISAVLVRSDPDFEAKLRHILDMCFESNCGGSVLDRRRVLLSGGVRSSHRDTSGCLHRLQLPSAQVA
jgi:ribonucleoside-triphosphate reductase